VSGYERESRRSSALILSSVSFVIPTEETTMYIIWWMIVGLIAGWLTGKIMRGAGYGVIGDIILGILGAIIGGFIMRQIGFAGQGGLIYTILVAVGGAVVLTVIVRALKRA
jgi:uncharacterized membrane protein YeaQ/YmgE (transglycosylase-associated protein family)